MRDDYDRLVATVRLNERVTVAMKMQPWLSERSAVVHMKLAQWIDDVTLEAKAAAAESAETDAEP